MAEVIVALDRPTLVEALELVDAIGAEGSFYKVGLELFTAAGPDAVRALAERGKRVFLDLKLHDIPNTVARAVERAAELGVDLCTVHASGGSAMLEAAREAGEGRTRILGVTVLTSMSPADVEAAWGREIFSVRDEVLRLARLVEGCGLDGVVASALEASWLRHHLGEEFLVVTPGIRPAGDDTGDQVRVATPGSAVEAGASHLVVGRSVTAARDPAGALRAIRAEVDTALQALTQR